jgi:2-succinyl-5-enolpyruvyl-6-hydroxy-3-cyclohexene-1-carboxylate synthase
MTRTWKDDVHVEDFISANGHYGSAKGWAENCGFCYLTASDKKELDAVKNLFVSDNESPILLEVFTRGDDELIAMSAIIDANRISGTNGKMASVLNSFIGEERTNVIKSVAKKILKK